MVPYSRRSFLTAASAVAAAAALRCVQQPTASRPAGFPEDQQTQNDLVNAVEVDKSLDAMAMALAQKHTPDAA